MDKAEGTTRNGVFKAIQAKPWISSSATAPLDPSNYLSIPFVAAFCQLLDLMGVFAGEPRRQLTIVNAFSAAVCLCIVYILVRAATQSRLLARMAVLFHLATAFFVNLAISNECIMPSYTLLFASMALACVWFVNPAPVGVCLVAALFPAAWRALIVAFAGRYRPTGTFAVGAAFCVLLLSCNIWSMTPLRGADTAWRIALDRIGREADPARTVFLLHGFEATISKMFYHWDGHWDYFATFGPSPTPKTKFKVLALVSGPVSKSSMSPTELAEDLQHQIEKAMALGYNVVASDIWGWGLSRMESSLSTVARKDKAEAIYRMLHSKFAGTPTLSDPLAGPFFKIQPVSQGK